MAVFAVAPLPSLVSLGRGEGIARVPKTLPVWRHSSSQLGQPQRCLRSAGACLATCAALLAARPANRRKRSSFQAVRCLAEGSTTSQDTARPGGVDAATAAPEPAGIGGHGLSASAARAAARRARRVEEYEELKRQSLVDSSVVGILGGLLAFFNSGTIAAEGFILGAAVGAVYLLLLHRDVDRVGADAWTSPFDPFNAWRVARLLLPLLLVLLLGVQSAVTAEGGVGAWLEHVRWEPGANFKGVVNATSLYAGMLGYTLVTLSLPVRGLFKSLPEAKVLIQAVPGSLGVAAKMSEEDKKKASKTEKKATSTAKPVPVLLVSGPRGCGKSTLVARLRQEDPRFSEPQWVATAETDHDSSVGARLIDPAEFELLSDSGALAVSYRPYADDGEQVHLGLPADSVILSALEGGACVLDVDPPTARALLEHRWDKSLQAAMPDEELELVFTCIWVSLETLDDVVERNRVRLKAEFPRSTASAIDRQLALLRAQATSDIEWAVTSGHFDRTVLNKDLDAAVADCLRGSKYCFGDPF